MRALVKKARVIEDVKDIVDKWTGKSALRWLYPNKAREVSKDLAELLSGVCNGIVCDVGCGDGRLARIFDNRKYIGIDINAQAINMAERKNPDHKFKKIDWDSEYPLADTYLFHNALLHIPDDYIDGVIRRLRNKVVVCEPMCGWFRKYGRRNNYHRSPIEYESRFASYGWKTEKLYHMHYPVFPYFLDVMVFERN